MNRSFLAFFLLTAACVLTLQAQRPLVLVTYYSKTGNTARMAEEVAAGVLEVQGVDLLIKRIEDTTTDDLLRADAIIVGSPVYNANVSPEVQAFISSWPFEGAPLRDKIGAAFVTAGGISAGEEITQLNLLHSMMIMGMIVAGGADWTAPFGASAVLGEPPFTADQGIQDHFLKKARGLGMRIAGLSLRLSSDKHD